MESVQHVMPRRLNETAWLILGPSGVGKTCFGKWLAMELNWLHVEIDRYPDGDGIDLSNLRSEWNAFYHETNAAALSQTLRRRLQQDRMNIVLTFPGNLVLSPEHITAASQVGLRTIYLYGSEVNCLTNFLEREKRTGRNYGRDHWFMNNSGLYMQISSPDFAPYKIDVFTAAGTRRPHSDIFDSLISTESGG